MEPASESRRPSSDWWRYVRPTTPDASGTTLAHPGREPKLQALTANSSRQASGDIRMEELRERHRNQMKVAFLTTACLIVYCGCVPKTAYPNLSGKDDYAMIIPAWNCVSVFARTSDSLVSRFFGIPAPSHHWTVKIVLDSSHAMNALSDVVLLYSIYNVHGPHKYFDEMSLNEIIRTFILWNAFTTVLIWGASCIDVFIPLIRSPIEEGQAVNDTYLHMNVTADHQNGDGGTVGHMGAALGFTGIAALKVIAVMMFVKFILYVLLLVYIYVVYLDTLENNAAFIVPETMATRPETSDSQADTLSTGNHMLGLRKGSRSSATQSYASLPKYHSTRNSLPLQRSAISTQRSTDTERQSAVPLTVGLEPLFQTMGSVYNDATEEAPLQVVPNKNRVSYVWGQEVACGLKGGIQSAESSLSHRSNPGIVSFDAINMLFFGGRRKPRTESRSPPFQVNREDPTNHPLTGALTETVKAKSGENPCEAMLPPAKFSYKEYLDDRQRDLIVQEPEQVPVLITGGSETDRNSGAEFTMTTVKQLMLKDGLASEIASHDQICQHLMENNHACDVVKVKVPGMTPTSLFDQALHSAQSAQETTAKEVIKPCYPDEKLNTSVGISCASVPLPSSDMSQHNTSLALHSFNPNSEGGCFTKKTPTNTPTTSHKIVLTNAQAAIDITKDTELSIPPPLALLDTSGNVIPRNEDANEVYLDKVRACVEAKDQARTIANDSCSTYTPHGILSLPSQVTFSVERRQMSSETDQNLSSDDTPKPKVHFTEEVTQRDIMGATGRTERDCATTGVAGDNVGRTQQESERDGLSDERISEILTGAFSLDGAYSEKMQ